MVPPVSFLVGGLGPDVDRFILHQFAALAEKDRATINTRTKAALASQGARCEAQWTEAGPGARLLLRPLVQRLTTMLPTGCRSFVRLGRPGATTLREALNARGVQAAQGITEENKPPCIS
jgi:hypothetical protein